MLLIFLADLIRNSRLQESFNRSPESVLDDAGLTPQARSALLSQDPARVTQVLMEELKELASARITQRQWPTREAFLTSLQPLQGKRGETLSLTGQGQWFDPNVKCWLKRQDVEISIKVTSVQGFNTNQATLQGTIDLSNAPAGVYAAYAQNPGQIVLTPLANAFEVIE